MKKPSPIIVLLLALLVSSAQGFTQDAILNKRLVTDTTITLSVTEHGYLATLELNRRNKTIVETRYTQHGKCSEASYNQYHTEIGRYKAFGKAGNTVYMVDNDKGTARLKIGSGEWVELGKPVPLVRSEALLRKMYGSSFVDKHIIYSPNKYFQYGKDAIEIKEHIPCPVEDTIKYTREFQLQLSNGKLSNAWLCVPFFLDTGCIEKIYKGCSYSIDFSKYDFNDSFEYYYRKAKAFGLSRTIGYTVMTLSNESCTKSEFYGCSGFVSVNLIEIMALNASAMHDNVIYNTYQFNPWTKAFMGKTTSKTDINRFLSEVIDFETEIYIHRFKDPLITRPAYLDDLIRLFHIERYQYILEAEALR